MNNQKFTFSIAIDRRPITLAAFFGDIHQTLYFFSCFAASPHTPTFFLMSGEVCQFGFRRSSVLGAQRVPGSVCQLSEHQRRSVGHVAQHPPGSAGEQHGPQRGTMLELQLCSTVCANQMIFFPYCYTGNKQLPLSQHIEQQTVFYIYLQRWLSEANPIYCKMLNLLLLLCPHTYQNYFYLWSENVAGLLCITSQMQADGTVADAV